MAGQSRVPDDLRPLAIWVEDINDLSFGWGYKTDDAYESPLAKIEFVEASVTKTDEAAWRAWRKKAEADYEQIGALPGPWGYSYEVEERRRFYEENPGASGILDSVCEASYRIQVKQRHIDDIFAHAPKEVGRYWLLSDAREYAPDAIKAMFADRTAFGTDQSIRHFNNASFYNLGTLSRPEGGFVQPLKSSGWAAGYGYSYRDVYPFLPRSASMPDTDEPQATYIQTILFSEEYLGFGACFSNAPDIDALHKVRRFRKKGGKEPFDPEGLSKQHKLFIGTQEVYGQPDRATVMQQNPPAVLDREGYFFWQDRQ